jgi:hypothetical protein
MSLLRTVNVACPRFQKQHGYTIVYPTEYWYLLQLNIGTYCHYMLVPTAPKCLDSNMTWKVPQC